MANDIVPFSKAIAESLLNSDDAFPVNLDDAWQWLGYATKQKSQNKLFKNFEQDVDYIINQSVKVQIEGGRRVSRPYLEISLTIDCFKSLGMMAGTEQGRVIRKYFLECERIVKEVIPAQIDRIRELELENAALDKQIRLREIDSAMLLMHGAPIVLALRGQADQVVPVEKPTLEVIDNRCGDRRKGMTTKQLADYLKNKTGIRFKSGAEVERYLQKRAPELVDIVQRPINQSFVHEENIERAINILADGHRQILIGE